MFRADESGPTDSKIHPELQFVSLDSSSTSPNISVPSSAGFNAENNPSDLPSNDLDLGQFSASMIDVDALDNSSARRDVWGRILDDQFHFYTRDSLIVLGLALGGGAAMANSNTDAQLQRHFETSVRGASSIEWFDYLHSNKELGNGVYTLPIMGVAWAANEYIEGPPAFETFGTWGERSIRAFIVGAPPLILMQSVTGGSRPYESLEGSEWHPFRDNNGVSGHAFMSSLPFITAAKMTDNPWQKTFWYAGSTIGPLSRVNDNAHYPSQVALGWAIAFVAASAVQKTETGIRGWTLKPLASLTSSGVALQYQW